MIDIMHSLLWRIYHYERHQMSKGLSFANGLFGLTAVAGNE